MTAKETITRFVGMAIPMGKLGEQIKMFVAVGASCALTNLVLLVAMVEVLGTEENLANAITSLIATYQAYVLNRWLIFEPGRHKRWKEISAFFAFGAISYLLNILLFYIGFHYSKDFFTSSFGESFSQFYYVIVKIVVIILIAAFNFTTRKFIVFKG